MRDGYFSSLNPASAELEIQVVVNDVCSWAAFDGC